MKGAKLTHQCICDEPKPEAVIFTDPIPPPAPLPSIPSVESGEEAEDDVETKKGQPGSKATFPNGLRDVHEMAAAAEALAQFNLEEQQRTVERSGESGAWSRVNADRTVAHLLNPCTCKSSGVCKCCGTGIDRSAKRDVFQGTTSPDYRPSTSASGSSTPQDGQSLAGTDLVEMFRRKTITSENGDHGVHEPYAGRSVSRPPLSSHHSSGNAGVSSENMHRPAHTSVHVHKTKLYSPYSIDSHGQTRHGARKHASGTQTPSTPGWASSSSSANKLPPPRIRPLTDMNSFLGSLFKDDGSIASSIPRSALGLPGISTFDQAAENGGVKVEPMEMDTEAPVVFPTQEDVVIGACTCGHDCDCPGCATHGNSAVPSDGTHQPHDGPCGENCKSCFNCADHLSLPSGITSIDHLLSIAAANVPNPTARRASSYELNALDTTVLPPSVQHHEDAARQHGVVQLKPLLCCNGRCQCKEGECVCSKECCGCCVRCACDEDTDTIMRDDGAAPTGKAGGCCSTSKEPATSVSVTPSSAASWPHSVDPLVNPSLVADSMIRMPSSSGASSDTGSQPALRRASSTSQHGGPGPSTAASLSRRATVSSQHGEHAKAGTDAAATKPGTKSAAGHHPPGAAQGHGYAHPHPRPILPKPPSASKAGAIGTGARSSAHPGPVRHPSVSNQNSRTASPAPSQRSRSSTIISHPDTTSPSHPHPTTHVHKAPDLSLPAPPQLAVAAPLSGYPLPAASAPPHPSQTQQQFSFDNLTSDADLMAYIDQLSAKPPTGQSTSLEGLVRRPSSDGSHFEPPLVTPDVNTSVDQSMPTDSTFDFFQYLAQAIQNQSIDGVPAAETNNFAPAPDFNSNGLNNGWGSLSTDWLNGQGNLDVTQPTPDTVQLSNEIVAQLLSQPSAFMDQSATNGSATQPSFNPNVIDLSKPLNAGDIDRILQALQAHQAPEPAPRPPQPNFGPPPTGLLADQAPPGPMQPPWSLFHQFNDGINPVTGSPRSAPALSVGSDNSLSADELFDKFFNEQLVANHGENLAGVQFGRQNREHMSSREGTQSME